MGTELVILGCQAVMISAPVAPSLLTRITADAESHFGADHLVLEPIRTEERPGSTVVRFAVRRSVDQPPFSHLFVKTYRPKPDRDVRERVVGEFEATKRVNLALQPYDDLQVVPAVACYPDDLTLVTEEVKGPTLLEHLSTRAAWFPTQRVLDDLCATMQAAGRWVRALQTVAGGGSPLTPQGIAAYVDHRLKQLVQCADSHFRERDRADVLGHVDRLVASMPDEAFSTVPVHGDMALSNVLVVGHRIVVLDFAMMKFEGALLDLARLYLQTELLALKPYMRRSVTSRLQAALLAGFDPCLNPVVPAFRLHLLIHRINNLTTVTLKPGPFPESVYNGLVARHHRRSLDAELRAPIAA